MNISNVINGAAMTSLTGKILPHMFSISLIYMLPTSKYIQESIDFSNLDSLCSFWGHLRSSCWWFIKIEWKKDGLVYIDDFFGNFMAGKLMANLPSETMEDVEVLFIRLIKLGGYRDTLTYHECRTIVHTVLNFTHPDIFDSSDNDSIINAFSR